jgi:pSer/pThr/pTyr-binding forkhead associated (FHA) protein
MQVNLVYFRRDGERRDFQLDKPVCVLGRRQDCGLQIPLMGISRQHCQLTVQGTKITVKDMGSSNGTYVNGKRVQQEQELAAGDRLQLGLVVFVVQVDGKPAEVSPPTREETVQRPTAAGSGAAAADNEVEVELEPDDEDAFAQLVMGDDDDDDEPIAPRPKEADKKKKK